MDNSSAYKHGDSTCYIKLPSFGDLENILKGNMHFALPKPKIIEENLDDPKMNIHRVTPLKNHKIIKTKILIHPEKEVEDSSPVGNMTSVKSLTYTDDSTPSREEQKIGVLVPIKPINQFESMISSNLPSTETEKKDEEGVDAKLKWSNHLKRKPISFPNERSSTDHHFLSSRCDVVYKTILRDYRRYFQNLFKEKINFSYRKKSKMFKQQLEEF